MRAVMTSTHPYRAGDKAPMTRDYDGNVIKPLPTIVLRRISYSDYAIYIQEAGGLLNPEPLPSERRFFYEVSTD